MGELRLSPPGPGRDALNTKFKCWCVQWKYKATIQGVTEGVFYEKEFASYLKNILIFEGEL